MLRLFCNVSDKTKGILHIIIGSILLLHTLGFNKLGLNSFLMIAAVIMMLYGFFLSGLYTYLLTMINKKSEH
ncbi:MAG: hypothetical protein WBQ73_00985 [Candidatus Babeliales bacterium]